jgi:hypothetical protein
MSQDLDSLAVAAMALAPADRLALARRLAQSVTTDASALDELRLLLAEADQAVAGGHVDDVAPSGVRAYLSSL